MMGCDGMPRKENGDAHNAYPELGLFPLSGDMSMLHNALRYPTDNAGSHA